MGLCMPRWQARKWFQKVAFMLVSKGMGHSQQDEDRSDFEVEEMT